MNGVKCHCIAPMVIEWYGVLFHNLETRTTKQIISIDQSVPSRPPFFNILHHEAVNFCNSPFIEIAVFPNNILSTHLASMLAKVRI